MRLHEPSARLVAMSGATPQLAFTPQTSPRLFTLITGVHLALAGLWCALNPQPLMLLAGLVLLGFGWHAAGREANALVRAGVSAVTATQDPRAPWRIEKTDGSIEAAVIPARGLVGPRLIVVSLVTARRRYLCVLDAENTPPDVHRRLRIRLRHARAMPATNV